MAQNPLLNEIIEERFYPIVDSIKDFFGSFGFSDRPPDSPGPRSPSAVSGGSGSAPGSARLTSSASLRGRDLPTSTFSPSRGVLGSVGSQSSSSGGGGNNGRLPGEGSPAAAPPSMTSSGEFSPAYSRSVSAGNQRFSAAAAHAQPTRTGSYHSDLCRTTRNRLAESPLRAASVDVAGKGPHSENGGVHGPRDANNFSSSSSLATSVGGPSSSQFRQTLAELGGKTSSHSFDLDERPPRAGSAGSSQPDLVPPSTTNGCSDEPDYAAATANSEKLGRIQFSVSYDFDTQTLTVKIIKAESLAAKDLSGTSDPYVKISLLPDKKHTLTTNIKRKNLNPRWNEVFAFEGFPYNKVVTKTLYLLVLDYDRFSRDDPIGEVCLPLGDLDLGAGLTMWKTLMPCKGAVGKLGVLQLSLCYQPTTETITIVIMKARNLKAKDINGLSDPYVKVWLMCEGKKVEKKKTEVKEKTLNPDFNDTFTFVVPYERIRQSSLVVSVMDYDRMGRNEAIGQLVLGAKSGPIEMKHWNEMFAKTRQAVTQWHILKDFG